MKLNYLFLSLFIFALTVSCEEDDQELNGTGIVNFTLDDLVEVENTTSPLNVNIGIDSYNHSGGTIEVSISGADYGTDYTTSEESASFSLDVAPQNLISTFSIIPIDNEAIEGNKVLTITLTGVSGALQLGESTTMTFTILENDDPLIALVGFENNALQIQENDSNSTLINIPFSQASTNGGTISVVSSGNAIYGTDFTVTGQTAGNFDVTVPAGATSASFSIQPIDNTVFQANKTVVFTIDEVSGGLSTGVVTQTTVTIVNDDVPTNPVVDFNTSNTLSYNEDAGTITLNFTLSSTTSSDATIVLTASGTATNLDDYNFSGSTSNPYSLVIPSGSSSGSVSIDIVDDSAVESDETIVLAITSVTGGLDAGLNTQQQTITISDNDGATAFNSVETFETVSDLTTIGYEAFILPSQDLPDNKKFKYDMNAGKYSDVDDVTQTSDSGLVLFYNTTQNGNGTIDNVVVTNAMEVYGDVTVSIDLTYNQAPQFNNAVVTFYYSESYNGSGTWNESNWTVMGTETAQGMSDEGFSVGDYKRKVMPITPSSNFYIAVRVNQIIDDTFSKTQWRLDNFKVYN